MVQFQQSDTAFDKAIALKRSRTCSKNYGDTFSVPEILPGWQFPVAEIWAPEFEYE